MNTAGPAFPVPDSHDANGQVQYGTYGMTLLDWFAGQALAGLLSSPNLFSALIDDSEVDDNKAVAIKAYEMAEDMLAEKARREADHSGDANKMVPNHSPDATKMVSLESTNRELAEALELLMSDDATEGCDEYRKEKARAILAKHKATT